MSASGRPDRGGGSGERGHGGRPGRGDGGGPARASAARRRVGDARRDPERTRQALLDAALVEFAEKGRAGARTSEIAARAGVNKQLISYHFGGKDGLYRALAERWLEREQEFADRALPLGDLVVAYMRETVASRDLTRLFLRDSVEDVPQPEWDEHDDAEPEEVADLRRRQDAGEIAPEIDPAFLVLVLQAAASVGVSFPGDVRRFTGLEPDSPEFVERYGEQLRRIAALLRPR